MVKDYTEEEKSKLSELKKEEKNILNDINIFEIEHGMVESEEFPLDDTSYDEDYAEQMKFEDVYYNGLYKKLNDIKLKIFNLENAPISREKEKKWNEEIASFMNGNYINEEITEKELEKDILVRKEKAQIIADALCNNSIHSPYNIAILGEWGTGKTSFCRYIKKAITLKNIQGNKKKKKCKDTYKIIDFNAAEYSSKVINEGSKEHVEQQWSNLLKVLLEVYENEHPILGAIKFNWIRFISKKPVGRIILYCFLVILASIPFLAVEILDTDLQLIGNVSGIAAMVLILLPVFKSSLNLMVPISDKVSNAFKLPNYIEVLGTREKIVSDTRVLLKSWLRKPEERIIVFVDDCDRCSIEGVMELFEAMHLFLDLERVFFVFAIDPRLLRRAISKYYDKEDSNSLVDQFLQKYVARTFILEQPDYSNYISSLSVIVESEPSEKGKHCLTDDEYKIITNLVCTEVNTPRSVKQIVNTIVSLKNYYMSDNDLGKQASFDEIILWYLLNYYYTNVSDKLRHFFTKDIYFYNMKELIDLAKINEETCIQSEIWENIERFFVFDIAFADLKLGMLIRKYSFNKAENVSEKI